eukprot:Nitzschia sp. Nitz4//scaffold28_size193895//39955//42426//NITZ4_001634-RA/size193895-processed-gene-0.216-mRNA-1//1//CDS//3329545889//8402//frame0
MPSAELESQQNTEQLVLQDLSLDEKIDLLSGCSFWELNAVPRWNLPSLRVSDGPHGLRKQLHDLTMESHPATVFPSGCALACSWNEALMDRIGQTLSLECQHFEVDVLLGPAMNIHRHPRGGRSLEYFSEDPLLTGTLAAAYVRGVQSSGKVGACLKHFATNNQETHRFVVSAQVDERTWREIYGRAFQQIVLSPCPPAMIMGAYNRLNGTYCCEHPWLIQSVLRDEWQFQGVCVTDWGASNDRVQAIQVGMDLEMPGNNGAYRSMIRNALQSGTLDEGSVDACVKRVLSLMTKYGGDRSTPHIDWEQHHQVARDAAAECVVMLKNDKNLLPLQQNTKLGVIGAFAQDSRYQGMGSSHCTPTRLSHVMDALKAFTDSIQFVAGYDPEVPGDSVNQARIEEACEVSKNCEVALLFLGLPEILESEGFDRETLQLPPQHIALWEAVSRTNDKVVVLLSHGGIVEMPQAMDQVSAILDGFLLGQAGGAAIADILFGLVSPSGRLAGTIPVSASDIPADANFPGSRDVVEHREGLNVGYRYFDSPIQRPPPVRFPFGHGLTYGQFEYSQLGVRVLQDEAESKLVEVSLQIKNVGDHAAKEVVQCYISPLNSSVYRPFHELKAFSKVLLAPGELSHITLKLSSDAFSFYDVGYSRWIVEPGRFEVQIAKNSQDIQLQQVVTFEHGTTASVEAKDSFPKSLASSDEGGVALGTDRLFWQKEVQHVPPPKGLHRNSLLKEVAQSSLLGRFFLGTTLFFARQGIPSGPTKEKEVRMVTANFESVPMRSLVLFGKGMVSFEFLDGWIATMNGMTVQAFTHFGRAFWNWIRYN